MQYHSTRHKQRIQALRFATYTQANSAYWLGLCLIVLTYMFTIAY